MRLFILELLNKIPWRSKFGMGIGDELRIIYYQKWGKRRIRCLCGGRVITFGVGRDGWETSCGSCEFLYDED
jgi:acetone carboxylase gamma subunit